MICSRCGKELKDFYVNISTTFKVVELSEEGCSIPFSNISEPTQEYLCAECFNDYCNCIDSMNQKNNGMLVLNMVEVIDDVQYGDGIPDLNIDYHKKDESNCKCELEHKDKTNKSLAEMVEYID